MKEIIEYNNLILQGINPDRALNKIKFKYMSVEMFKYLNNQNAEIIKICKIPNIKNKKFARDYSDWKEYRKTVWNITKKQDLNSLPNIEKRGFKDYHLDHRISIWYGYKNKINPFIIGDISNLKMIPCKENMLKGVKSIF
jgi:hypothetical protein